MIPVVTDLDAVNRSMAHACQLPVSLEISELSVEENPQPTNSVFIAHSPMKNRAEMHVEFGVAASERSYVSLWPFVRGSLRRNN
jgi:hypothetical protein